jgi:hypothetical protein
VASDGDIVGSVGLLSGLGAGRDSSSLPQRCVRGRYSGRWRRISDFIVLDFTVVTLLGGERVMMVARLSDLNVSRFIVSSNDQNRSEGNR